MIWLKASGMKSANCRNATGRWPTSARPIAVPTIVDSVSGRIAHAAGKARREAAGDAEDVALGVLDVLAEQEHALVVAEVLAQHRVECLAHRERRARAVAAILVFFLEAGGVGRLGSAGGLGAGLGAGLRSRFGDLGDQSRLELGQRLLAHLRHPQRLPDGLERIAGSARGEVLRRAVDLLVVGIGVVRQPLEIEDEAAGRTRGPGGRDGSLERGAGS
jgi:hypothetical protein